jgi:hypothetical protein
MRSRVSQHSEPARKQNVIDTRLRRLRAAIEAGEGLMDISREAEKVRLASLALIKAERALIRENPHSDPDGRQSWNLQDEEQRWLAVSTEAIIQELGRDHASPTGESGSSDGNHNKTVQPRSYRSQRSSASS